MADVEVKETSDSAEKAYAAAAEASTVIPAPVDFPAKAKRAAKPETVAAVVAAPAVESAPAAVAPVKAAPVKAAVAKVAVAKVAPIKAAKPKAIKAKVGAAKVGAAKVAPVKVVKAKTAKPKAVKTARIQPKPAAKPVVSKSSNLPVSGIAQLKEKIMATTKTDFTSDIKQAASQAQAKAKEAFAKTSAVFGEYGEFTKGNAEALVESGKILAGGLQELGKTYAADGRAAVEVLTADVKAVAAVKSPADFFALQGDLLRRNVDSAYAFGTKNGEALFKLANAAFKPLAGRYSLAVEKMRKAA